MRSDLWDMLIGYVCSLGLVVIATLLVVGAL
jgi:hypothetical protein